MNRALMTPGRQILYSLLFFCILPSYAQDQLFEPVVQSFSSEDGLPSSQVYQIKQDSKGYVWFATDNGVSKFDGNEFTNYTYSNGLCVRILFGIYEDPYDRIWFYSYSGELVYYDHKDNQMHCPEFNSQLNKLTRGKTLNGIFFDQKYLYTYDYRGNTYQIDLHSNKISLEESKAGIKLRYYKPDGVLIGFQNSKENESFELEFQDFSSNKIKKIMVPFTNKGGSVVPSVLYNKDLNQFYFTINRSLFRYDPEKNEIQAYPLSFISTQSLVLDKDGLLWIGSFSHGVYAFQFLENRFKQVHHFLDEQTITSIMQDKHGGYWFSSKENGVFYTPNIEAESFALNLTSSLLTQSQVLAINKSKGSIFFSNEKGQVVRFSDSANGDLEVIGQERRGFDMLYVKGDDYVNSVNYQGKNYVIRDYYEEDSLSLALVLSENRVGIYEKQKGISSISWVPDLPNERFKEFLITQNGNFYVGNNYRLIFYDSDQKRWTEFKNNSSDYKTFEITSISSLKGDSVWVSTRNRGIFLAYKDQILFELNRSNGFPIDFCKHILYHNDKLYVSTNEGILRVENDLNKPIYTLLNKSSGLLSNEVFSSIVNQNHLYIATNDGLCRIDTQLFDKAKPKVKCRIEEIKLDSISLSPDHTIQIDQEDILKVKFVANSFSNAFKIPYRYRLKKGDKWNYTRDNTISISNLGPASYHFEVQAAGAFDNWGESESFEFNIKPKFWETLWFTIVSVIGSLLLLSLIFWFRLKQANKMNALKSSMVNSQNRALSAQMNPHFIFNSLNSISHGILNNDTRSSVLFIGKFGKLMRTIFENSEETFITLTEEMQALRTYLELEKLRLQDKLNYQIHIDPEVIGDQIYLPALLLQPFVENAIWHGIAPMREGEGMIEIKISKESDSILIRIEDNGVGIQMDQLTVNKEKSAIQIAKKRLDLIKQIYKRKISFSFDYQNKNALNKGTIIELVLPILNTKP